MAYPSSQDTFLGTATQATSPLTSPDHALSHRLAGSALGTIEQVLGTTNGTAVLKNFAAGDFAARINSSGILQQSLTGTVNLAGQATASGTMANGVYGTILIVGGTINNATLGTPVVNHFTSSGTSLPTKADAGLAPTVGTLSDSAGGTIAINAALAQVFELTLGTTSGNRTLAAPANPTDGQVIAFRFKQNSNNTGTIVFNSIYRMNQGGTPSLGTQSTWNYTAFRYNTTDSKWDHQGNSLGII